MKMPAAPIERRLAKFFTEGSRKACWEWRGSRDRFGYGQIKFEGRMLRAHRFVFEYYGNVIPEGLHLDHLCKNKGCVNPSHLEPVTSGENKRRWAATVTECPAGHVYDEANTHVDKTGRKHCRTCDRQRHQERYDSLGRKTLRKPKADALRERS